MIEPNAALPKLPFGFPSGGVLVTLNASARNSAQAFGDGEDLADHHVSGAIAGSDDRVAGTVADGELRRLGEGGSVEPARRGALIGGSAGSATRLGR